MEKVQTHYEPEGAYVGHHPDVAAQAVAETVFAELDGSGRAFQEFLDTTPNHNAEYQPALDLIGNEFAEDGLEIAPISILGHDDYLEAKRVLSGQDNFDDGGRSDGGYSCDRVFVDEEPMPDTKEIFGQQRALGTVIHEAAHSTARTRWDAVSSRIVEGDEGTKTRVFSSQGSVGGFNKHVYKNEGLGLTGNYWEEAFADLTRARYSQRLGIEPRLSRHDMLSSDTQKLTYVSESADLAKIPEDNIVMPARFAAAINDEGEQPVVWTSSPGFAAYGLELLDQKVPGLFEEMQASRRDPVRQRKVIKMIDSVRPGLYKDLRDLPYSEEGFRKGLEVIQGALAANEMEPEGAPALI